MFARASTFRGDPAAVGSGLEHVESDVRPMLETVPGFVGLSVMVDRGSGELIVTTSWETLDAMRASGDRLTTARDRFGGIVGTGQPPKVQEWEVAAVRRAPRTPAARWCRVAWVKVDVDVIDRGVEFYRLALVPRIVQMRSFASCSLFVDRVRGRACSTVCFEGLEAMQMSREEAWALREASIQEIGLDILDAAEYELAIAHLRVPDTIGAGG